MIIFGIDQLLFSMKMILINIQADVTDTTRLIFQPICMFPETKEQTEA